MAAHSIREASRLSGLPASTLRYYETVGILPSPTRDPSSNHRVYRDDDLDVLEMVACLQATGLSLEEMREYLRNRARGAEGPQEQIVLLQGQAIRLAEEARQIELRQRYVEKKIAYWQALAQGDQAAADRIAAETTDLMKALTESIR